MLQKLSLVLPFRLLVSFFQSFFNPLQFFLVFCQVLILQNIFCTEINLIVVFFLELNVYIQEDISVVLPLVIGVTACKLFHK